VHCRVCTRKHVVLNPSPFASVIDSPRHLQKEKRKKERKKDHRSKGREKRGKKGNEKKGGKGAKSSLV
jgi:hypothetical protein